MFTSATSAVPFEVISLLIVCLCFSLFFDRNLHVFDGGKGAVGGNEVGIFDYLTVAESSWKKTGRKRTPNRSMGRFVYGRFSLFIWLSNSGLMY